MGVHEFGAQVLGAGKIVDVDFEKVLQALVGNVVFLRLLFVEVEMEF